MLKTNSKKAMENIRKYIIENVDFSNYGIEETPEDFRELSKLILDTCKKEKFYNARFYKNDYEMFKDWCQGLPSCGIGDFYYFPAVKPLAEILEETEEEAGRFTERQAEEKLCYLIYRELQKALYK